MVNSKFMDKRNLAYVYEAGHFLKVKYYVGTNAYSSSNYEGCVKIEDLSNIN